MSDKATTPIAVADAFPMFRLGIFAALHDSTYEIVQLIGLDAIAELIRDPSSPITIVGLSLKEFRNAFLRSGLWRDDGPPLVFVADAIIAVRAIQSLANDRAHGVLHRTVERKELLTCLDTVSAGGTYVSPSFDRRSFSTKGKPRAGRITHRQAQIARMLHAGMTNAEIAGDLSLSVSTVDSHVKSLREKLGVRNRTQIARILGPDVQGGAGSEKFFRDQINDPPAS